MKFHASAVLLTMSCCATAFNSAKHTANRVFAKHGRYSRVPMAMFSTVTENAMLQQESLPKFASIEPAQLTPAVSELVDSLDKDFASFEAKLSAEGYEASYENVMPELEKMQFPLGYGKFV